MLPLGRQNPRPVFMPQPVSCRLDLALVPPPGKVFLCSLQSTNSYPDIDKGEEGLTSQEGYRESRREKQKLRYRQRKEEERDKSRRHGRKIHLGKIKKQEKRKQRRSRYTGPLYVC